MLLTIGMIVKNEEKYLDKCLSAIKPILDNVDSELIVTDTGSSDRTVEIAKKYTDKVLHFDWINDFSAARNTGIENACGEWFMYLDADEIFCSCGNIISFFNSGEYKSYNSASFIIRNLSADGSFNDFNARRLAKLTSDTRFSGVVHEHLNTLGEPCRQIDDIADHYGYIFENDADRLIKFERNYQLLLQKYETVKDSNPMIYAEMYDTLVTGFKQREADEYLEKGIGWCIKHEHPILILLYCKKARHLLFDKQNDDALKVCDTYFGMSKNIRNETIISDAEILVIKATALYRQERWSEASEALVVFFDVYDAIKSGKLNTKDKLYGSLSLASDSKYLSYVGQFLVCCLNTGEYGAAAEYMEKLPIYKYSDDRDTLNSVISLETILLENVGFEYLDKFCTRLDNFGKKQLIESAEKIRPKKSNNGKIILTIGMIVKNEEKYLDRCLSAIKPILDNVASELIITDTGSTDRTVEIAKKYTDKVLHFDWINDFAAARNTALDIANGEWFMFLDADEIFCSCDNIIDFFRSGEYKKYNSATFTIRNIYNADNNSDYSDFSAPRLVRSTPETRFQNIVHETLNTFGKPIKHINDIADHYGYAYDSNISGKFGRNSALLLKRLENEPDNEMLYVQLYECYSSTFDRKTADEYLDKAEELCLKKKSIVLTEVYTLRAQMMFVDGQFEQCVEICRKYFDMDKEIRPFILTTDAEIRALSALSYYELGRYEEACGEFCGLFDILPDVLSGRLRTNDAVLQNYEYAVERRFLQLLCNFVECCLRTDAYSTAEKYLVKLPISEYSLDKTWVMKLSDMVAAFSDKTDPGVITEIVGKLSDEGKKYFFFYIYAWILNSENKAEYLEKLSVLAGYGDDIKEKNNIYHKCFLYPQNSSVHNIMEFAERYDINDHPDLLYLMLHMRYDITELLCLPSFDTKRAVYMCCKKINDFYNAAECYFGALIRNTEHLPVAVKFYEYCISMRLMDNKDKTSEEKERLIGRLFTVKNELDKRYKRETSNKSNTTEFEQLALMLKSNVRNLAAQGKYDDARKFLDEYKKLSPNDPEILELYNLLN